VQHQPIHSLLTLVPFLGGKEARAAPASVASWGATIEGGFALSELTNIKLAVTAPSHRLKDHPRELRFQSGDPELHVH